MSKKSKSALHILEIYAEQNKVLPRSTSDLSKLEEWLILELINQIEKNK
jgi:hypothetical protein